MGTDFAEVEDQALKCRSFKVHRSICTQLAKLVDKVSRIVPAIEATRPGPAGIKVLCSLNNSIERAESLLQQCSNSSILYLAVTCKKFHQRCNGLKKLLEEGLGEIHDMVPVVLGVQISQQIADLRNASLRLDSSDEEAGKVLRELLQQGASTSDSWELGALQHAASRLKITTQKALLIERRSIKNLLLKVGDSDPQKKKILEVFFFLLKKHQKFILGRVEGYASSHYEMSFPSQHSTSDSLYTHAVGPTVEPASPHSLDRSSWSIDSLGSSMKDLDIRVDLGSISLSSSDTSGVLNSFDTGSTNGLSQTSASGKDCKYGSTSLTESLERGAEILSGLSRVPWESQIRIIEDLKSDLQYNDRAFSSLSSENFIEPLLKYMRDAQECCDLKAQRAGFQLLMEFLSKNKIEIPYLHEDAFNHVASFLNSEVSEEALSILELLSDHQYHSFIIDVTDVIRTIAEFLNSQNRGLQEKAIKLLYTLSTRNDVTLGIVSVECIPKLVSFLDDSTLAGYSMMTLRNLCNSKEGRLCFGERNKYIESVVKLLDVDSHEVQEHGLGLLLSLCSQSDHYCRLALDADIFPPLFYISVNGNDRGKVYAFELLRLLRD